MTNINLYQSSAENSQQKKLTIMDSGFFWSLGLLLLVLAFWGGLRFVSNNLEAKKASLTSNIEQESASFAGSDLNRIVDFQARMDESSKSISTKRDTDGVFSAVEKSMVNGIRVGNLSYSKKEGAGSKVDMEMVGGDFPSIARQILSLKENQSFGGVSVQEIARGEAGITIRVMADLK